KTSAQAVWSLVLGILSIACLWLLGSIPAICLGIVSLKNIARSGGALKGRGLGIAGIVTGSIGILTGVALVASLVIPAISELQRKAQEAGETGRFQLPTTDSGEAPTSPEEEELMRSTSLYA